MKTKNLFYFLLLIALVFFASCEKKQEKKKEVSTEKKQVYNLKLAQTWTTGYPILGDAVKEMVQLADELSEGRLKIRVDSSNKHKSPFGIFDMVKAGQYDIGHSASYYWKGKDINTLFFTTMPFGMITPEQYAWFYHGGGMELMERAYAPHNLLSFPGGNIGNQMGGWFQKEINTVEDLKGLKMRIPGFAGEVLNELGTNPINIPPGELFTALERRAIDALEWVGPSLDLRMGFHQIASYYYTGWHEPASELQFLINKDSFNKLPKELQTVLVTAMKLAAYDMYIFSYHESAVNLETLETDYPNVKIKTFPKEVMQEIKKANDRLIAELEKKGGLTAEIIQSQKDYLTKSRKWTKISDYRYIGSL